ncbi:MAG: hypothetical protein EPN47_11745 [Acidobacteria bacterium]|nr:MAG: hypothetical protein EPN47_11745 [Acidobacteriota bacterium]
MPRKFYFDTDIFRNIGKTFENAALPNDLRGNLLVSPLSAFEVISQLSTAAGDEILRQIHAIRNWVNPERAGMLPWPDDVLLNVGFGMPMREDDFTQRMANAFKICLAATSVEPLREEAHRVKEMLDETKLRNAQDFGRLLKAARRESPKGDWFSDPWYQGIARRVNANPETRSADAIAATFNAYREFERVKLQTALKEKDYNVEKHKNDLFDAEQLIYLGSPDLYFLTCDKGFSRVNQSAQFERVMIVPLDEISDVHRVEALLRKQLSAV